MRLVISIKTLLRKPLRTFLAFLLLAAATFALFSRATEYAMTARELDLVTSYYKGVATIDNGLPNTRDNVLRSIFTELDWSAVEDAYAPAQPLTTDVIEIFASLPQVTSIDIRYMTAGFSEDGFTRLDLNNDPSYNYTNRFIVEGTYYSIDNNPEKHRRIQLYDCELLAGDLDIFRLSNNLTIWHYDIYDMGKKTVRSSSVYGYPIRVVHRMMDSPFGSDFKNSLIDGERYLAVGRWEPRQPWKYNFLGDLDTMDFCPSFWRLDGLPENYIELDEFAPMRELIEITNDDLRTFDMVYTSDMLSIPRFAEQKMLISEGRSLTPDDTGTSNCVVGHYFLQENNLNVGDTISMSLGSKLMEQHATLGAVACVPERYSPPGELVELTIVGVFRDTDALEDRLASAYKSYSPSTIFVPLSLLHVDVPVIHSIMPGEYSLVVGDVRDSKTFLEAAKPLAEEMGLTLLYNDGGWSRVEQSIEINQQLSLNTAIFFFAASAVAVLMALWLFMWYNRKSYAIMRALGTSKIKAQNSLLIPFSFICILAMTMGSVIGLTFSTQSVAHILESIAQSVDSYVPNIALPFQTIIVCLLSEIIFIAIAAALFMRLLEKTPVLALLQNTKVHIIKDIPQTISYEGKFPSINKQSTRANEIVGKSQLHQQISSMQHVKHGPHKAFQFILHHALRHTQRSLLKAIIALLLSVLMCSSMGLVIMLRQNYFELYRNIEVKAFLQYASSDVLEDAVKSDLFRNTYYHDEFQQASGWMGRLGGVTTDGFLVNENIKTQSLIITNDIERFLAESGIYDYGLVYTEDFSGYLSQADDNCVIGSTLAYNLGISLNDIISVCNSYAWDKFVWEQRYLYPEGPPEHPAQRMMYTSYVTNFESKNVRNFKVGGIVDCDYYGSSIFLPVGQPAEAIMGAKYTIRYSEHIVADNDQLDEALVQGEYYRSRSTRLSAQATFIVDTSERENIESMLELLNTLFPYAVVAAVAIGVIAPFLMLLLSAKEAAVMRVLGTTKRRARSMLVLEQAGLCMFGIALAAIGLYIYDAALMLRSVNTLLFCGALYVLGYILASVAASFIVTHRKPLELLQVKE